MHETINTSSNINGFMKYAKLHRVLIMTEYAWIILGYAWMCLNMAELPIVIPYLETAFLESKNLIFFYSSWKYLILLIVLNWIFLHIDFKFAVTYGGRGGRESWIFPNQWYPQ